MVRNPFSKPPPKKQRVLRTAAGLVAVAVSLVIASKWATRKSADTTPATDETEATS